MKFTFLLFFLGLFFSTTFSQNSTASSVKDTLSENQISYSILFSSNLSLVKDIQFQLAQITEGDTLIVFESSYSFLEKDPSTFKSFSLTGNTIVFGLGSFDIPNLYTCKINIRKQDESIETIIIN